MIIAGALPGWRRWYHFGATGFMCLLFLGFVIISGGIATAARSGAYSHPGAPLVIGGLFAAGAIVLIAVQVRGLSSIVREFRYDGATLRFSTLTDSQPQVRQVSEIRQVREMTGGRGPGMGYWLEFQDGRRVVLDDCLTNVQALVYRLQLHVAV